MQPRTRLTATRREQPERLFKVATYAWPKSGRPGWDIDAYTYRSQYTTIRREVIYEVMARSGDEAKRKAVKLRRAALANANGGYDGL